jgi:hypothetical protein
MRQDAISPSCGAALAYRAPVTEEKRHLMDEECEACVDERGVQFSRDVSRVIAH